MAEQLAPKIFNYLAVNYPAAKLDWVKQARWTAQQVPTNKVVLEKSEDRNHPVVDTETKALLDYIRDGKPVDRIIVLQHKDGMFGIVDGHHRTRAYVLLHKPSIAAYVGVLPNFADPWQQAKKDSKMAQEPAVPERIAEFAKGKGNLPSLLNYWHGRMGEGAGRPGDYNECVAALSKHPKIGDPHGLCQWLHIKATGHGAGRAPAEVKRK